MQAHRGRSMSLAEFKALWLDETVALTEIAERLNISITAVRFRAESRGLPKRAAVRINRGVTRVAADDMFPVYWEAGVGRFDMMRYYGIHSHVPLGKAAKQLGLTERQRTKYNDKTILQVHVTCAALRVRYETEPTGANALSRILTSAPAWVVKGAKILAKREAMAKQVKLSLNEKRALLKYEDGSPVRADDTHETLRHKGLIERCGTKMNRITPLGRAALPRCRKPETDE